MVARSGDDKDPAVGIEAFRPEHRKALTKTVNSKDKVDKVGSPGRFHSSRGHRLHVWPENRVFCSPTKIKLNFYCIMFQPVLSMHI